MLINLQNKRQDINAIQKRRHYSQTWQFLFTEF